MKTLKTYHQFSENSLTEGFTITKDKLPKVGDVVDKIDYKDGDRIAFVDFKGVKNIPIHVLDGDPAVAEPDITVAT